MDSDARLRLEDRFHERMYDLYREAKKAGYDATAFLAMVRDRGGLAAAQHCLGEITDGFTRLWSMNRLDLSVEFAVLEPRWTPLFTDAEREVARRRLRDARVPELIAKAEATV
jgi:hypothetical protein